MIPKLYENCSRQVQDWQKIKIKSTILELYEQRSISKSVHISDADIRYDTIMGMDLLSELGIDILSFSYSIKCNKL